MKRLFLTGQLKDYVAAALALRHFKTGEILGMSTRRLPEFLNDCTGWNEIVILGSASPAIQILDQGLRNWRSEAFAVRLISTEPPPESIGKAVLSKIAVFVGGEGITDAVSQCSK